MGDHVNPFLAEMYGTFSDQPQAQPIGMQPGDDVEKLAQLQLLDEMLTAENIDIEKVAAADLQRVAEQLFGPDNVIAKLAGEVPPEFLAHQAAPGGEPKAEEKPAEEKKEEEKKDEAKEEEAKKEAAAREEQALQEKIAEFDFLGRLMAHAFENERQAIEKQATATSDLLQAAKKAVTGAGARATKRVAKPAPGMMDQASKWVGKNKGLAMGGAALGGAGLGYGLGKAASALDILAARRAEQIVAEKVAAQGVPAADDVTKLAERIEQRAQELAAEHLKAQGIAA